MKDLTEGPVWRHVLQLSTFIALTTFFQTLYFLADLYFVGRLGKEAVAGVGLAGNLMFVVLALTQSLGVGATALVAQAMGRKDRARAELVFNQALVLSHLTGLAFGVVAFLLRGAYTRSLAADAATAAHGLRYLDWFIPALCLQFVLVAMGAALRGVGDLKHPTLIQIATVVLNIVLAPVLMFGWGTGRPMGVAGTALATFVAVFAGCLAFIAYFRRAASPLRFRPAEWRPQPRLWWEMLRVGLPAGGEFALVAVYFVLVYDILRPFGAAAQAGFGIGARVMQAVFLPAVAIGFATAPVAGQNFGARRPERVREAFRSAAAMSALVMAAMTAVCQAAPGTLIGFFSADPAVVAFGAEYLRIISWNFVASGLVFVSSSVFQGLGNTLPALFSSVLRIGLFALPAYLLARQPTFQMRHVWYVSLASIFVQTCVSLLLLRRELARKLVWVS
jgi:putative MATE family efflux protein